MNRQEINLYTIDFHRSDQMLSVKQIGQLTAVAAVLMMLFYGFSYFGLSSTKEKVSIATSEYQNLEQKINEMKVAVPKSNRPELERKISIIKSEIAYRENLGKVISGKNLGNAGGFSHQLTSLARNSVSDLSLTEIKLLNGGTYLELAGWVTNPASVPAYLHDIRQEDSFSQVKFGVISIEKGKNNGEKSRQNNELKFSLGKAEERVL